MMRVSAAIIGFFALCIFCALVYFPFFIYKVSVWETKCEKQGGEVQDFRYGRICWSDDGRRIKVTL